MYEAQCSRLLVNLSLQAKPVTLKESLANIDLQTLI